ncbi:hypothetical protein FOXYS1_10674 [Fusarium oxysporum]|uniref:Uncharacterized protein n=1 Tax=Fusarium oxysporum TaxID=5507 RepID=A0A8H5A6T7_FUSOX|nr:hypothetical protein FOXYS1_10674 [Fusarium oxysporum]
MYRLLSPKKRPDREVEACCILSKDVDTPGPKNLVRALEDYKLEQDKSFEDWVKTILMLLAPNMVESTVLISHIAAGRREPHTPKEMKCIKNKCPNQRNRDESDLAEEKQGASKRIGK